MSRAEMGTIVPMAMDSRCVRRGYHAGADPPYSYNHRRCRSAQSEFSVGTPITILPPCAVASPTRMMPLPLIRTKLDPLVILSGSGMPEHRHCPPSTASGMPLNRTKLCPAEVTGPPTCGLGPGSTLGHICIWPASAIGFPMSLSSETHNHINGLRHWRSPSASRLALVHRQSFFHRAARYSR